MHNQTFIVLNATHCVVIRAYVCVFMSTITSGVDLSVQSPIYCCMSRYCIFCYYTLRVHVIDNCATNKVKATLGVITHTMILNMSVLVLSDCKKLYIL